MRQRPTPETEAEIRIHTLFSTGEEQYLVRADFARKLERERDEARGQLRDWGQLFAERDALQIKLWSAVGMLMAQPQHRHRTREEMLAYIEEAAK